MNHRLSALLRSQVLALCLLSLLLFPQYGLLWKMVWLILAAIFIFVLPGYWISYLFFNRTELSAFERFVTSIALSLAVIVFVAFYLHYFGIAVYPIHIYVISCVIIAVCWLLLSLKKAKNEKEYE